MPIPGARYRVKTTKKGKKVRLAFKGGEVVEAKNLESGKTHTATEFSEDRRKQAAASRPAKKAATPRRKSMRQIFG